MSVSAGLTHQPPQPQPHLGVLRVQLIVELLLQLVRECDEMGEGVIEAAAAHGLASRTGWCESRYSRFAVRKTA